MGEKTGKREIVICLGSSCFSRGNKKAVQLINAFLDEQMIRDKVHFHGAHCFGNCAEGAILRIDDKVFEQVEIAGLKDLLTSELGHLIKRDPKDGGGTEVPSFHTD